VYFRPSLHVSAAAQTKLCTLCLQVFTSAYKCLQVLTSDSAAHPCIAKVTMLSLCAPADCQAALPSAYLLQPQLPSVYTGMRVMYVCVCVCVCVCVYV